MSVPNQKRIIIGERKKRDRENLYAMINLEALQEAMKNLKGSSLKLWLYCDKNQNKYEFDLSRVACQDWGIKKYSYYSGFADLVMKGYLVPIREGSNTYIFCETANSENKKIICSKYQIQNWEIQNDESENQIGQSEKEKRMSENLERNITNNIDSTKIIQDKTIVTEKATEAEIMILKDVIRTCTLGFFENSDVDNMRKLLQKYSSFTTPAEKIEHMSSNEKFALNCFHQNYCSQ